MIIEHTGADVGPRDVWTNGIERDLLVKQIFAIRTNKTDSATANGSVNSLDIGHSLRRTALLLCRPVALR